MMDDRPPSERVNDVEAIGRAMRQAVREALWQHKRAGNPVPVWQDGRVVWIPASELVIPDDEETSASVPPSASLVASCASGSELGFAAESGAAGVSGAGSGSA